MPPERATSKTDVRRAMRERREFMADFLLRIAFYLNPSCVNTIRLPMGEYSPMFEL